MFKLYITYSNEDQKATYYIYKGEASYSYVSLNVQELNAYVTRLLASTLKSVRSIKDDLLEVVTDKEDVIVIDERVFLDSNIKELITRIKAFMESEKIKTYKNSLPENYIPKVNRNKNNAKYLMENSLWSDLLLAESSTLDSLTYDYDSEMKR